MDWKYYNHAALPNTPPHETPDLGFISTGKIWKIKGHPLLARWTTEFDKSKLELWWYLIKDTVFDVSKMSSKKRYEINKGNKYFNIRKINPNEYVNELFNVQSLAYLAYPKKYREKNTLDKFLKEIIDWKDSLIYAAFNKDNDKLCGYCVITKHENYFSFDILKSIPEYEHLSINAALIAYMLNEINENISNGFYICDGERNVNHETNFQDYLIKNFGFRKAYCNLHIAFNWKIKWLIAIFFGMRKYLLKFDNFSIIHKINAIVKMYEISKECL